MDNLLQLAKLLALLSASALCVYLIVVLTRLNKVLEQLQMDLADIGKNLRPVLENLNIVMERFKSISMKVDDQVTLFKSAIESFKQLADNVVMFEERVQRRLEEPIHRVSTLVGNIISRIASFVGLRTQEPMN
ncbi:MAG: DUF948 domain-containing protein [Ignavibacteriales bacterium]|nr:DUF948 domain-containing protein [Ignavibacteriales bacterium]